MKAPYNISVRGWGCQNTIHLAHNVSFFNALTAYFSDIYAFLRYRPEINNILQKDLLFLAIKSLKFDTL